MGVENLICGRVCQVGHFDREIDDVVVPATPLAVNLVGSINLVGSTCNVVEASASR
jgi:hypothetical protein